ncbi:MAG: extracellular solute-binding protein [Lachnospiraceae bacterium]|jgi:maltose-binding protein MalE|nr:extracellular solute-binding protein [Lachnospiraceae bacterium]
MLTRIAISALSFIICGMMFMSCTKEVPQGTLQLEAGSLDADKFVYVSTDKTLFKEAAIDSSCVVLTHDVCFYIEEDDDDNYLLVSQSLTENVKPTKFSLESIPSYSPYHMRRDINGNLHILWQLMALDESGPNYIIAKYDGLGQKLSEVQLQESGMSSNAESFIFYMALDGEGNLYLADNKTVWLYGATGTYHGQIEPSGILSSLATNQDGKVYMAYQQSSKQWLARINFQSKSLEKTYDIHDSGIGGSLSLGYNDKLLYYNGNDLFEFDPSAEVVTKILNWIDCNVDGSSVRQVTKLTDDRFVVATDKWLNNLPDTALSILTKTLRADLPDKELIVFGVFFDFYATNLSKQIAAFNKSSNKYEIVVKTYIDVEGSISKDERNDAMAIINSEIIAGQAPDILLLPSDVVNWNSYAEKDVFVDLNEMLAQSQTLKKEDLIASVVRAFTYDGKLVGLPTFFSLDAIYGKQSNLGNRTGMTLDELSSFMDEHPNQMIFKEMTKRSMLHYFTSFHIDSFLDLEHGTCPFDGKAFQELLELANRFPNEIDAALVANEEPLLHHIIFFGFDEYQGEFVTAGEPVNFIGYPTPDREPGIGLVAPDGIYTITSQSKNKEGAWLFLESLLTEEDDGFAPDTLHVNKKILDKRMTEVVEAELMYSPFVKDENGEKIPFRMLLFYGQVQIILPDATREDVDGLYALIDCAVKIISETDDIMTIVLEEAEAYFNGSKTLEQVTDIIQNRAKNYVSENQ